jgi:hypothetical protein
MAYSTKIEWIVGGNLQPSGVNAFAQGAGNLRAEYNYTHIFRVPWTEWVSNAVLASSRYGGEVFGDTKKRRDQMDVMLDQIETAMRASERHLDVRGSWPLQMAGSVPSLLGRWPHKTDYVQFSILRDMTLRRYPSERYMNSDRDARAFEFEYLIELSWIAYRKDRA